MKRLGPVRARPGQIRLKYGSLEGERDFIAANGDGAARGDAYVLFEVLRVLREKRAPSLLRDPHIPTPSFLEELEARGFDPNSLEITIQKKVV